MQQISRYRISGSINKFREKLSKTAAKAAKAAAKAKEQESNRNQEDRGKEKNREGVNCYKKTSCLSDSDGLRNGGNGHQVLNVIDEESKVATAAVNKNGNVATDKDNLTVNAHDKDDDSQLESNSCPRVEKKHANGRAK